MFRFRKLTDKELTKLIDIKRQQYANNRNVSYVTTYIIRSDYYSVTDKFNSKNNCTDWELTKLIDIKQQEYANNRNVSYVTTHIIRSDYYLVTDKFKFKKQLYGLRTNEID